MVWKPATHALRALVIALLLPLALSAGLPTLARALGGAAVHVCQCEARAGHSACACPICHPDDEGLRISEESIRGKCGADDLAFGGALGVAVLTASFVVLPAPSAAHEAEAAPPALASRAAREPPTPPPRLLPV
jgi:hypothetical protein